VRPELSPRKTNFDTSTAPCDGEKGNGKKKWLSRAYNLPGKHAAFLTPESLPARPRL
jgi:hypothetical protein